MKNLSIIVPCFNNQEIIEKNISILKKKIKKIKIRFEIIIINDGSSDKTQKKLVKLKSKNKLIRVLVNKRNFGKSYSVLKGLKISKYDHVVLIDSDLPYLSAFDKMIKKMKIYDFVFINRKHKKSSMVNKDLNFYQVSRYIIGYIISLIIRFFLGLNIQGGDTQSGLKGFKKTENIHNVQFISKLFFLDLELMHHYRSLNKKFCAIPVKYKIVEQSSIKLLSFKNFSIILELFKVILKLKRL